jgi:hypothetical protein
VKGSFGELDNPCALAENLAARLARVSRVIPPPTHTHTQIHDGRKKYVSTKQKKNTFPHQNLPSGRKIGFLTSKAKKRHYDSTLDL